MVAMNPVERACYSARSLLRGRLRPPPIPRPDIYTRDAVTYGRVAPSPGKKWADLVLTPGWNNEQFLKVPDWAWVPGKIYADEAAFRADMP